MTGNVSERLKITSPWQLTRLDKYIAKQLGLLVVFGLLVFSIIWFAPETLFDLVQATVDKDITLTGFFELTLLYIPEILLQITPMAALIASVFLFKRLSQDFELVAFFAAGISPARLLVPLSIVGVSLMSLHFFVQEVVLPITHPPLLQKEDQAGIKGLEPQNFVFFEKQPGANGTLNKLLIAAEATPEKLSQVFWLYFYPKNTLAEAKTTGVQSRIHAILKAKEATWQPDKQHWLLKDGIEYELDTEGIYRDIHPFKEQVVQGSPYGAKLLEYVGQEPATLSLSLLNNLMQTLRISGQEQSLPFYEVRWHQKLAQPLSVWVLIILGSILGYEPARNRRIISQALAALVLFVYLVAIPICTNLGILGILPPIIAGWLPITLASAMTLLYLKLRQRLSLG